MEKWHAGWRWFQARADGVGARVWLFLISFTEPSVFLIPPDPLLAALVLANKRKWAEYALITTVASVAGALFGYLIGLYFFDTIGERLITLYGLQEAVAAGKELFDGNVFWVVFIAAFTPIPYKVFVLLGGFLAVSWIPFLLASIAGRGLRFFAIAYIVQRYGSVMLNLVMRNFNIATAVAAVAVLLWVVLKTQLLPVF